MKKKLLLAAMACAVAACSEDKKNDEIITREDEFLTVELSFMPYTVEPVTRTVTGIADVVTQLDVWLYENGSEVAAFHQAAGDAGFGSLAVTLNKTKTYTLYAVGHRAGSAATLADGIITFPDDRVTHSMYYATTFTPGSTTALACLMERIVAAFRLETTDAVPSDANRIVVTFSNVFNRWSVTAGGVNPVNSQSTVNLTSVRPDGTVTCTTYAIVTNAQTQHDITVTALDADGNTLQERTFNDVPLRNGYRTTYRGVYFTDTNHTATFSIGEWQEYDVIEF